MEQASPIDHIVVDVEIQKTVESLPNRWDDTHLMRVAVAVVYEFQTGRYRVYGEDDVPALCDRLEVADRISGFNIWAFDYPVIWGEKRSWRHPTLGPKTNDILRRIWLGVGVDPDNFSPKTHGGYSLDNCTAATFNERKVGHGAAAPKWYQEGKWPWVVDYSLDDVRLESNLTVYAETHGHVLCNRYGTVKNYQRITLAHDVKLWGLPS